MSVLDTLDFTKLFSEASDIHCVVDQQGIILCVNERMQESLGWSVSSLVGKSLDELIHEEDLQRTTSLDTSQLAVSKFRHEDGSWRWIEWSATPLGQGRLYAVGRDVTARVKEEEMLMRQKRLFAQSLKLSRAGYFLVDAVTQEIFWSDEIYTIHGVRPETYTPVLEDAIKFYHPEDRPKVEAHLARAVEYKAPFEFQLRLIRKNDGQERLVHSIGLTRQNDDGEVIEVFGVFRDVTEDLSTVRQEELEQFSYMASHDLREPLRILRMYLELSQMALDGGDMDDLKDYWSRVTHSAARMDSLINDLSRYAMAGQRVELRAVSLEDIIEDAMERVQRHAKIVAEVQISPDLPHVFGDRVRLMRAFEQLISNAFKYGQDAEGSLRIGVNWLDKGSHVEITLCDRGPGIEERFTEKVFRPFHKLEQGKEGTGMGLAIVRRIIRQCDGRVWATSTPGKGACFHISLLRADAHE